MSMVYVLLQIDPDTKLERPVAVVSSEEVAEKFYQSDTTNHDWIPFNMDEVPMMTGIPSKAPEPTPQSQKPINPEHIRRTQEAVNQTRQTLDQMSQRTKQVLDKLRQQRRSQQPKGQL